MSYQYATSFSLNASESLIEKMKAQQTERRIFGNSVLAEVQGDLLQTTRVTNPNTTTAVNQQNKDPNDDGKISFKEKVINFGKGLVQPIKTIFESPKNMLITAAGVLGGAALIAATGGAAAPFMVAAGVIGGGIQIGKGIHKQANAKTDAEAAQAWQQMGSGTFTVGVSVAAAKGSMKAAKSGAPKGMEGIKTWFKGFKDIPKNIGESIKAIPSKIQAFFKGSKSATAGSASASSTASTASGGTTGTPRSGATTSSTSGAAIAETPLQPASTTARNSTAATVINTADGDVLALSAPKQQLALPAGKPAPLQLQAAPEIKLLPEPTKPLLLEAPKTQAPAVVQTTTTPTRVVTPRTTTNTPIDITTNPTTTQQTPKVGLLEKFKNILKVFGLFLDEQ